LQREFDDTAVSLSSFGQVHVKTKYGARLAAKITNQPADENLSQNREP
jgi:hypothetical protein